MVSSSHRFFGNVSNCWLNSYGKFGGATRRRFFAIHEKPEGGGADNRPPAVRGLSDNSRIGNNNPSVPLSSDVDEDRVR